jgi:6-phosphogluconolactonase
MAADAPIVTVRVLADAAAVARAGAEMFVAVAKASVAQRGTFAVALSGGRTPATLYDLLASDAGLRADIPWSQCCFFFGDERHVPPDHRDSNYRMAREALLSRVPVEPSQVFRICGEQEDAERAAREYDEVIRAFFHLAPGEWPRFDLMMLGLGPDGHVASLFPHTRALQERGRLVTANWVDQFDAYRITVTVPVINESAQVMLLVQGQEKASALQAVLHGPYVPEQLPAQLIRPRSGTVTWLVDRAAGALLEQPRVPRPAEP